VRIRKTVRVSVADELDRLRAVLACSLPIRGARDWAARLEVLQWPSAVCHQLIGQRSPVPRGGGTVSQPERLCSLNLSAAHVLSAGEIKR